MAHLRNAGVKADLRGFIASPVECGVSFCCAKMLGTLRLMHYITTHARRGAEQQTKEIEMVNFTLSELKSLYGNALDACKYAEEQVIQLRKELMEAQAREKIHIEALKIIALRPWDSQVSTIAESALAKATALGH